MILTWYPHLRCAHLGSVFICLDDNPDNRYTVLFNGKYFASMSHRATFGQLEHLNFLRKCVDWPVERMVRYVESAPAFRISCRFHQMRRDPLGLPDPEEYFAHLEEARFLLRPLP